MSGSLYLSEIHEQPDALRRLVDRERDIAAVARAIAARRPASVRLVGHGSSDNAASFGVYAFGLLAGCTAFRDSISLSTYYGTELDVSGAVVIALSQSGRTPDVIDYVAHSRAGGAFTVAITNDATSPLSAVAEAVVPLAAAPEHAVAATKTYTNQLAALALLAAACANRGRELADAVRRAADIAEATLPELAQVVTPLARSFSFVSRMFVIGRGIEFATARETALKLTETCRIAATPLTATDLAHGPVAALDPLFPVWTVASSDDALPTVVEASALAREAGAVVIAAGNAADATTGAAHRLPVPAAPERLLAPLLSVLPGQLFAAALATAKGLDPDRPTGLEKVTLAR